jgi:hypothetical protein
LEPHERPPLVNPVVFQREQPLQSGDGFAQVLALRVLQHGSDLAVSRERFWIVGISVEIASKELDCHLRFTRASSGKAIDAIVNEASVNLVKSRRETPAEQHREKKNAQN